MDSQPAQNQNHNQAYLPMDMNNMNNNNNSMDELQDLFSMASPNKGGGMELPDFGVFGPDVASLLLSQPDLLATPQLLQTPSMVEASPDIELIAPVYSSRKGLQGTPGMTPNLTLTPTMASPHTSTTGLFDMHIAGNFGFFEPEAGPSMPFGSQGFENILQMVHTFNQPPTLPSTISPSDVFLPTLTPGLPYTPGQLLDTPSVGTTSPLLETPGRPSVPLVTSTSQSTSITRKRSSPLSAKRERSEDNDTDGQSSKKRKHTGTRPGISSTQLLPPGAPPQQKTYLTESSTSRKDVPASYKVKAGDLPDDSTLHKIVAKRTANRDSARRSRQRKQQAMENAMDDIRYLTERVNQLEDFCRENGLEPPLAPHRSPRQELEDDFE